MSGLGEQGMHLRLLDKQCQALRRGIDGVSIGNPSVCKGAHRLRVRDKWRDEDMGICGLTERSNSDTESRDTGAGLGGWASSSLVSRIRQSIMLTHPHRRRFS